MSSSPLLRDTPNDEILPAAADKKKAVALESEEVLREQTAYSREGVRTMVRSGPLPWMRRAVYEFPTAEAQAPAGEPSAQELPKVREIETLRYQALERLRKTLRVTIAHFSGEWNMKNPHSRFRLAPGHFARVAPKFARAVAEINPHLLTTTELGDKDDLTVLPTRRNIDLQFFDRVGFGANVEKRRLEELTLDLPTVVSAHTHPFDREDGSDHDPISSHVVLKK